METTVQSEYSFSVADDVVPWKSTVWPELCLSDTILHYIWSIFLCAEAVAWYESRDGRLLSWCVSSDLAFDTCCSGDSACLPEWCCASLLAISEVLILSDLPFDSHATFVITSCVQCCCVIETVIYFYANIYYIEVMRILYDQYMTVYITILLQMILMILFIIQSFIDDIVDLILIVVLYWLFGLTINLVMSHWWSILSGIYSDDNKSIWWVCSLLSSEVHSCSVRYVIHLIQWLCTILFCYTAIVILPVTTDAMAITSDDHSDVHSLYNICFITDWCHCLFWRQGWTLFCCCSDSCAMMRYSTWWRHCSFPFCGAVISFIHRILPFLWFDTGTLFRHLLRTPDDATFGATDSSCCWNRDLYFWYDVLTLFGDDTALLWYNFQWKYRWWKRCCALRGDGDATLRYCCCGDAILPCMISPQMFSFYSIVFLLIHCCLLPAWCSLLIPCYLFISLPLCSLLSGNFLEWYVSRQAGVTFSCIGGISASQWKFPFIVLQCWWHFSWLLFSTHSLWRLILEGYILSPVMLTVWLFVRDTLH